MQLSKNVYFKNAHFAFFNEYLTLTLLFLKVGFCCRTIVNLKNCFRQLFLNNFFEQMSGCDNSYIKIYDVIKMIFKANLINLIKKNNQSFTQNA